MRARSEKTPPHPTPTLAAQPHLAARDRVCWVHLHQGGKRLQEQVAQALADDHMGRTADGRPELLAQLAVLCGVQPAQGESCRGKATGHKPLWGAEPYACIAWPEPWDRHQGGPGCTLRVTGVLTTKQNMEAQA